MTFAERAVELAGFASMILGWRPADFWESTPAELAVIFACGEEPAAEPLTRDELARLMERDGDG